MELRIRLWLTSPVYNCKHCTLVIQVRISIAMGMYSVVEPDEKILEQLKSSKSTLIVGCANCANISIAHDKNKPVYKMTPNKKSGKLTYKPVAILEEAKRLQKLLKSKGMEADTETSRFFYCAPWSEQSEILDPLGYPPLYRDRGVDSVVVLTCSEGLKGMNKRVNEGVKVVWGMRTIGGHEPVLSYDSKNGFVSVDEAKSKFQAMS